MGWNTQGSYSNKQVPQVAFNDLEVIGVVPLWNTGFSQGEMRVAITEIIPEDVKKKPSIKINARVFKKTKTYDGPDKNGMLVTPEQMEKLIPLFVAAVARYNAEMGTPTSVPASQPSLVDTLHLMDGV